MKKLRNFLYLNTTVLDEYLSVIEGYSYEDETISTSTETENNVSGNIGIKAVSAGGERSGKSTQESSKSVKISPSAKFDKLYEYLNSDDNGIKSFDAISNKDFNNISRDDFIECFVTIRFSKLREMANTFDSLMQLTEIAEALTGQTYIDDEKKKQVEGINQLSQLKSEKSLSCVFEFDDKNYPLIAELDKDYLLIAEDKFIGQFNVLCKVLSKVPEGKKVRLDDIFEGYQMLMTNNLGRKEKRKAGKQKITRPQEINDVVKGPAFKILPIALYQ